MRCLLHIAARSGQAATVELLLTAEADVHAVNRAGLSPLRLAEGFSNAPIARKLPKYESLTSLSAGNNPIAYVDNEASARALADLQATLAAESQASTPTVPDVSTPRVITRAALAPMSLASSILPTGENELRLSNPNSSHVSAGIRHGLRGRNLWVPAGETVTTYLPAGAYYVYFIFADQPGQLLQGEPLGFPFNAQSQITLTLQRSESGNYSLRPVWQ